MKTIQLDNVCKRYGEKTVLQDFSAVFEEGITCLMAPSGAGKTTLLRILTGLETSDAGTVTGRDGLRFSVLFQENRLLEQQTARRNLTFALGRRAEAPEKSAAMLEALGLDAADERPVREYSGGMKRRVALARALLVPADVLLLDEPFAGLDEENRNRAMEAIRQASAGKIVVLITHERTETMQDLRVVRL